MKYLQLLFFASIFILTFSSCSKNDTPPAPIFTEGYNVYMVGESDGIPGYWKNGVFTKLAAGSGMATSIAVSGNDVYIGGQVTQTVNGKISVLATVWKNGVEQHLNMTGFASIYGITLNGSDVYAVGLAVDSPHQRAVYWKNGKMFQLSPGSEGAAYDMKFMGTDRYVAGHVYRPFDSAVFWKNDVFQAAYGVSAGSTHFDKMLVDGQDLYIIGSIGANACIYKNQDYTQLSGQLSGVSAIIKNGQDIYVSGGVSDGNGNYKACYWKNSTLNLLGNQYASAGANGIGFAGNDLYVLGTIYTEGKYKILYWKNGAQEYLSPSGMAHALLVTK